MKRTGTGRVLATLFIGIMFGIYRHVDEVKWLQRGRDAYMAVQSRRFERITQYHATGTMLIAGVIIAAIAVGLYEVIAAGFTRLLPPSTVEE
jgi:hypothetical protein